MRRMIVWGLRGNKKFEVDLEKAKSEFIEWIANNEIDSQTIDIYQAILYISEWLMDLDARITKIEDSILQISIKE